MTEPASAPACPVLWVEDDPVLSDWVAEALQDAGWQVLVAHDRPGALALIEREVPKAQPCVALLDMGLPPHPGRPDEGLQLLAQLVRQWPLLHAVVLTGQGEAAVGQQAVQAGAFDFLTKPVASGVLRQALQRAAWFALRQQELLAQGHLQLTVAAQLSEGLREASDQVAEQIIRHVLGCNGFNVAAAARSLGLEREQLYYHMKKFGIQRQAPLAGGPGEG
ncbi:response regulator [Melaminivora sp.]|uniref:response regulator n=1 Tax=Melaminivora sp. TaxID=1933032 RepID=UPI0028AF8888|nr:response regulator [Melaminivora sp.]